MVNFEYKCVECGDFATLRMAYFQDICRDCRSSLYYRCEMCGYLYKDDDIRVNSVEDVYCKYCL